MKLLITGAAGFIGYTLAKRLLDRGDSVYGIDNLNDYYDVSLKQARLKDLEKYGDTFAFSKLDITDRQGMKSLFRQERFDRIMHLAAQAGVRYSLENPLAYIDANLVGFGHVLEGARSSGTEHLVFASSSSVYGANTKLPFSESDNVDHPVSLYAATKKSNELMAHTYAHLYGLPCTGLRFFTVYGPWGRPDMALFKFTQGIINDQPIPVYNYGNMIRDFTYVDDIVEGIVRVIDQPAKGNESWSGSNPDPASSLAPYRIYNIGNNTPVELMKYIEVLESSLGKKAKLEMLPIQDGDVPATFADTTRFTDDLGFKPETTVEEGVSRFVDWYCSYYKQVI
ncbi:NAD-dependent epimerase [Pseudomonadota bacterium]